MAQAQAQAQALQSIRVACNVVGLYIPGQRYSQRPPDAFRNVIMKPFYFIFSRHDFEGMTPLRLLELVMDMPGMEQTRAVFPSVDCFQNDVADYFDAFRRVRKTIPPQFTFPDHPSRPISRMSYEPLEWNAELPDLPEHVTSHNITFAIWQPRQQIDRLGEQFQLGISPLHITELINEIMPNYYVLPQEQQEQEDGGFRWPDPNDATRLVVEQARAIVRDSILWDLEKELLVSCKEGRDLLTFNSFPQIGECIMKAILKNRVGNITLREFIALKLDTLPFFAVCIDLEHWTNNQDPPQHPPPLQQFSHIKNTACPVCHFHSENHSFYRLHRSRPNRPAAYNDMNTLYMSGIEKLPTFKTTLYRGLDLPPEWLGFSTFPAGNGNDPRRAVQSEDRKVSRGKCRCFPFHPCARSTIMNQDVAIYEHTRDHSSFSSNREYAMACYARFRFGHFADRLDQATRADADCGCNCAGCNAPFVPAGQYAINDIRTILNSLNDAMFYDLPNGANAIRLAAEFLIARRVCAWASPFLHTSLVRGPLCQGTLLEFEYLGRNVDAISAEQFVTGVHEFEFVVTQGSQMELPPAGPRMRQEQRGLDLVAVIKMDALHNVNTTLVPVGHDTGRAKMAYEREKQIITQKLLNTRKMLPRELFLNIDHLKHWADPETWSLLSLGHITFGCFNAVEFAFDTVRSMGTPIELYSQLLEQNFKRSKGRLAHLFPSVDLQHKDYKPMLKDWNGMLENLDGALTKDCIRKGVKVQVSQGNLCKTFAACAREQPPSTVGLAVLLDLKFTNDPNGFNMSPYEIFTMRQCVELGQSGRPNMRENRFHLPDCDADGAAWMDDAASVMSPVFEEDQQVQDDFFGFRASLHRQQIGTWASSGTGAKMSWHRTDAKFWLETSMISDDMYLSHDDDAINDAVNALGIEFVMIGVEQVQIDENPRQLPANEDWLRQDADTRRYLLKSYLESLQSPRALIELQQLHFETREALYVDVLQHFGFPIPVVLAPPLLQLRVRTNHLFTLLLESAGVRLRRA